MNRDRYRVERKVAAFTLVELLVVIVIIALLAALLFPAFNMVRQRFYMVQCLQNQHTLHAAIVYYAGDHNGELLPYNKTDGGSACLWSGQWSYGLVAPSGSINKYKWSSADGTCWTYSGCYISYEQGQRIFGDNSQHGYGDSPPATKTGFTVIGFVGGITFCDAYGLNYALTPNGYSCYRLSEICRPSQVILLGDRATCHSGGVILKNQGTYWLDFRHGNQAIVTFVDGHSAALNASSTNSPNWMRYWLNVP